MKKIAQINNPGQHLYFIVEENETPHCCLLLPAKQLGSPDVLLWAVVTGKELGTDTVSQHGFSKIYLA